MRLPPLLTPAEKTVLEDRILAGGPDADQARDELAARNLRIAVRVGCEVARKLGRPDESEDYGQEAARGVVLAARAWIPCRGEFHTFAFFMARRTAWTAAHRGYNGEHLSGRGRAQTVVPEAERALAARLGRPATLSEVASELGWSAEVVSRFWALPVELDDPEAQQIPDSAPLPDACAASADLARKVGAVVATLRPTRRAVVIARYSTDEPTFAQIGEALRVTGAAAHMRHGQALDDLRPLLAPLRSAL